LFKERQINEGKTCIGRDVWLMIVELVRSLIGAPPEMSHLVALMDTLIILHPVNVTYVTHLKNTFYFLLSAGSTYNVNYTDLHAAQLNRQHSSIIHPPIVPDEYTNPVDAGKLNKALINLQLRGSPSSSSGCQDSNRFSDDVNCDSGLSENAENDSNVVKAVDGSQQNMRSFYPRGEPADDPESETHEKFVKDVLQVSIPCSNSN